jgi:dTDP-4-amino-4,6-dideoxygalactose transaminase
VHYEHIEVGYNYRMSNLLAALGRAQLTRLEEMMAKRRVVRDVYRDIFAAVPGAEIFGGADDGEDNCWLTAVIVDPVTAGWSASELSGALSTHDIESRPLWKPMHLQPVFADMPAKITGKAEELFCQGLTLPSGSALTHDEVDRVISALTRFVKSVV